MTDRLTALLHDSVAGLETPTPEPARIIADGRALRRRRRAGFVAAAAAVAVVAAVATLSALSAADHDSVEPTDRIAYQEWGAWASGSEVHVGEHVVTLPGVITLGYTSLGAVARTGEGDYTLVTSAGRIVPLQLEIAGDFTGRAVATDPASPYLAYVRAVDDSTDQLVVRDLSTGDEQPVGAPFPDSSVRASEAVQLWGDVVYWTQRGAPRFTDWRTGAKVAEPRGAWSDHGLAAGTFVTFDSQEKTWVVVDRSDGSTLLTVPAPSPTAYSTATLSFDGRYLAVAGTTAGFTVYDAEAGRAAATFDDRVLAGYSWTPDDHLVGKPAPLSPGEIERCDPGAGTCTGTGVEAPGEITLVPAATSPAS